MQRHAPKLADEFYIFLDKMLLVIAFDPFIGFKSGIAQRIAPTNPILSAPLVLTEAGFRFK
jgi:hypothetical protein